MSITIKNHIRAVIVSIYTTLRSRSKEGLALNNVSEWSDMSICRLNVHYKNPTLHVGPI